jgi:hypothetical protein
MRNYTRPISEKYNTTKFNKAGGSFDYVEEELSEKLYGKQKNIDKNRNGKIDKEDFKMLRGKKETKESRGECYECGGSKWSMDEEMDEGNAFTKMLKNTKKGENFTLGGRKYKDTSSLDEEETIYELEVNEGETCECGSGMNENECTECGMKESDLLEFDDEEYMRGFNDQDMEISNPDELQTFATDGTYLGMKHSPNMDMEFDDEYPDMEIPDDEDDFKSMRGRFFDKEDQEDEWDGSPIYEIELDADTMDRAKSTSDFWNDGDKTFRTKMYEYEIYNEKLGRSFRLTEEQVVNLIENLAEEKLKPTKKTRGYSEYERSFDKSGKENEDYYKEVSKKMRDYTKDGSMEDFTMDAKHFPMGNGELKKMDKMAYVPSDSVAEYVENFTAAALENIDYDTLEPKEEWVKDNVVGSSRTGNNPKWGNAVETPTNKKRNEIREKNLLAQIKKKAYNKSPQPIVKDRTGQDDASDLLNKVESGSNKGSKKSKKINEDLERIGSLISYGRKTQ